MAEKMKTRGFGCSDCHVRLDDEAEVAPSNVAQAQPLYGQFFTLVTKGPVQRFNLQCQYEFSS